jgi:hypothetical protein
MKQDLFSNLKLRRNDRYTSVGGRSLIPREGNLKESVKPRQGERRLLFVVVYYKSKVRVKESI